MQLQSTPRTAAASPRLSHVQVWQALLTYLLKHHYGLTLHDTHFHDDDVIQEHINAGIMLRDAVNFIVEKYDLVRTDCSDCVYMERSPYLRAVDLLRARQATGLLRHSKWGYQ